MDEMCVGSQTYTHPVTKAKYLVLCKNLIVHTQLLQPLIWPQTKALFIGEPGFKATLKIFGGFKNYKIFRPRYKKVIKLAIDLS